VRDPVAATNRTRGDLLLSRRISVRNGLKAVNEIGCKPKMLGGGMWACRPTALKVQLGLTMSTLVLRMVADGRYREAVPRLRDRISESGGEPAAKESDALGYCMAPFGHAQLQVLQQRSRPRAWDKEASPTKYTPCSTFQGQGRGDVKSARTANGRQSRVLQIQFHAQGQRPSSSSAPDNPGPDDARRYKSGNVISQGEVIWTMAMAGGRFGSRPA